MGAKRECIFAQVTNRERTIAIACLVNTYIGGARRGVQRGQPERFAFVGGAGDGTVCIR